MFSWSFFIAKNTNEVNYTIMPVDPGFHRYPPLIQREQYDKGGLGRWYWDRRDQIILDYIRPEDHDILDLGCGEGITLERLHKKISRPEYSWNRRFARKY